MTTRKLSFNNIRQVQVGGGPNVNLRDEVNSVSVVAGAEDVNVRITLTSAGAAPVPVRVSVYLTQKDPAGTLAEVVKRHRKSDLLFSKRKRVTPGAVTGFNIKKEVFDEPNTIYIIHVRTQDNLAAISACIHRTV